jgi:hypothetical protein
VDRDDPDDVFQTMVLPVYGVSVNQQVATAHLGVDYIMRQAAVTLRANPYTLPGIF